MPEERIEELLARLLHARSQDGATPCSGPPPSDDNHDTGCPPENVWRSLALRECGEIQTTTLIEHAAGCQRCGSILNFWSSILSDLQSPAESAFLSHLSALTPAWQERMTTTLVAASVVSSPVRPTRARMLWPSIIGVAGALAATALVFLFLRNSRSEQSPERLLAEAYSGHRIMDTRIPMAAFAPVDSEHHTRAASAATLTDSVPLLEARAAISQALMKTPEDPHWLLLEARSDLLNANYDPAIETLKRLLAGDPNNVGVLTDLASAYAMRAQATDTPSENAAALDYLAEAARIAPRDPVVLYNEAIVLGDLYQYATAVDVWKKFLAVEHDKAWLADGRRRLAAIQALQSQTRQSQSRLAPFLRNPEGMLHLARSPDLVAQYDERLSPLYLPQLLQAAFPIHPSSNPDSPIQCPDSCAAARALLEATAASLQKRHHDQWLADLLASPPSPAFAAAANTLAIAIARGHSSHFADGLQQAESAQRLFEQLHNPAGAALSASEQVFDLQHFLDDRRCLSVARQLAPVFARHHYPWIEAEFWADESGCHSQQNDFAAAKASLDHSMQISDIAGYPINHLRAFDFTAALEQSMGNRDLAWKMNLQGLRNYWAGSQPAIRGQQLYTHIAYIEQASDQLYASVLMHRESVSELEPLDYPQLLNANQFLLVRSEIRAGETEEAAEDLEVARRELAALPERDVVRETNADIGILLAEAYLTRSDTTGAARELENVAPAIAGTGNHDMELRYAAAMGHLALRRGNSSEAYDQLTQAASIAEKAYRETRGIQDRIDWIELARPVYAELALLRLYQGKPAIAALAIWERYRLLSSGVSPEQWCRESSLTCLAPHLEAARKNLRQETVLGVIRLDESLILWSMDDRGIHIHEVPIDPARFDRMCHAFSEVLATPQSSEAAINFYSSRLSAALLTPAAAEIDPHRALVFDLDDSIEFLPVNALLLNGGYLGLEFPISTVHSMLLADRTPSPLPAAPQSIVVGASLPGDSEAPPLPEARAEALAVAGYLTRPRLFIGADATANSIEAAAPHAALIHFAGHTRFIDGRTRLLLARRGSGSGSDWLDARAFSSPAFAGCRLVVLAACSTGKREDSDSGDIQDIVQTLTAQGAQQIVATHWDVDSAASVALMKAFYSGLARGLTVPQAMLQAKRSVTNTAEYRHPYYWAPYYVIGISRSNLKELLHDE
jgi:CHAT domain-containing protein/tetratricopeptide (TPR) repeat protein